MKQLQDVLVLDLGEHGTLLHDGAEDILRTVVQELVIGLGRVQGGLATP